MELSPASAREISLLQNVQTSFGAHLASYSVRIGVLFWGGGGSRRQWVNVTTHFHLISRLRMSWAIPLLPHMLSRRTDVQIYCLTFAIIFSLCWRFIWLGVVWSHRVVRQHVANFPERHNLSFKAFHAKPVPKCCTEIRHHISALGIAVSL
jgi:hypothetical protein